MRNQYDSVGKEFLHGVRRFFCSHQDISSDFILSEARKVGLKNRKILDLGCGGGDLMLKFIKNGANQISGIDQSGLMLSEARRLGIDATHLTHGSFEKTKFKSKSFDIVISRFAIQHLKSFTKLYLEVMRILKSKGHFIFVVPHPTLDFLFMRSREYGREEVYSFRLFRRLVVRNYSHPLYKYLSSQFLSSFDVKMITEGRDMKGVYKGFKAPEFLGISAQKRA